MKIRRAAGVLASCFVALAARRAAGSDVGPPYDEVLAEQSARLAAHPQGVEAAAALAALAALDENVPPAALEEAIRRGTRSDVHPLVAAQAAFLLAHLVAERGASGEAAALRAGLGFLTHWLVVGPFGEGRPSFGAVFPPEREAAAPEVGRRYRGKNHEVGWRAADGAVVDGALFLDGLLRPDDQAAAYVATEVRSDADRTVALRLGSPGPIKVWVNGGLAFARDVVRPAALDQDAAPVRLQRGWNRILIKTVVVDGAWRLYARLTDPGGGPIALESAERAAGPAVALPEGRRRRESGTVPVSTLADLLERRARAAGRGDTSAEAWLDLARFLAWNTPRDRDQRAAALAAERSLALAPSLAARLVAAEAAVDDDERRLELERALEIRPPAAGAPSPGWRALLLERLGELARIERRPTRALELYREALATDPGCWAATLAIAQEEVDAGLPLTGLGRAESLPATVRALPRVRRAAARFAEAADRPRQADRLLQSLAAERRIDVELLHQLATRARARGDEADAVARLTAAASLRPDLPAFGLELARVEEGAGRPTQALEVLTSVAARLPDDPAALVALGKLLHRMGRSAEALRQLRAAALLRPQDPELKRYVDRLAAGEGGDPAAADELARRFAVEASTLIPPPAPSAAGTGDAAIVLLDRRVVRVHDNGLSRTFAERVVQVLTERGAEDEKEFEVHYAPGSEEVDIRQARIYRRGPTGELEVLEATDRSDEDLSEPWYGLYYDNRAEVVRFEGLRPGDVIEIQYLVDDVGQENQMADYFGDLQLIAENIPKRRWDYTLIAPASRPIHTNTPQVAELVRQVSDEGADRVYRFAATNVAKVDAEPAMPGAAEIAPYLHVSTYATWKEVGTWYWHLVEDQLTGDEEFRRTARALVTSEMTDEAKLRAVYDFVVKSTRYVGLELGIHGFKPYKVTQVLERRFGDCKDKASLMVALLREVGVAAELVLVRTRREGRLDPEPASLAIFDHAIVYVPKLGRYLDGTAEFAGLNELPAEDQGVMVLRVGPSGGVLTETPVLPSSASRVDRRWQVAVEASGDARVEETLSIRGQAAPNWREHYQTSGERADRYGRVWAGRFPGARLTSVEMPGIGDRDGPVSVRAVVAVPQFGQPTAAGAVELPVSGRDADFVRTYARLSTRAQDLVLAYPWQHDEELSYRLPRGWRLTGRADSGRTVRDVESAFGRFHLEIRADGEVIRVRSLLDVARSRIAPAEYPRFRAFLGEVDAAIGERLVIAPPQVGS